MDARVRRFREEVNRRVPVRGAGKRFPPELRQQAVDLVHAGGAEGLSQLEMARRLGVRVTSLRRWMDAYESEAAEAKAPSFREVKVVPGEAAAPVVVLPNGIRIEGLDLDGVVALLDRGSTRQVRVFGFGAPTDMRKGFDGLSALVKEGLGRDPLSGEVFLFVARNRQRAKVLLWDGTGLCVYAKRLERGRFVAPWEVGDGAALEMTMSELSLFLEGSRLVGRVPLSPPPFALPTAAAV